MHKIAVLYDELFLHYYWSYTPTALETLHGIFNQICHFPLELTLLITEHLEELNLVDRYDSLVVTFQRDRLLHDLLTLRKEVTGIGPPKGGGMSKLPKELILRVDPATWLSAFAYDALPYQFGLGHEIISLVLEHPKLRTILTDIGLRAVQRSRVRGVDVAAVFRREIKSYIRVTTKELYRRHVDRLLDDVFGYDVYYTDNYD